MVVWAERWCPVHAVLLVKARRHGRSRVARVVMSRIVMPQVVMARVVNPRIVVARILMARVDVTRVVARIVHVRGRGIAGVVVSGLGVVVRSHLTCVGSRRMVGRLVTRIGWVTVRIKWHQRVRWGPKRGIMPWSAGDESKLVLGVTGIIAGVSWIVTRVMSRV
jgi:ABC-type antimicrobial peptide transport system ATPase subunit